MPDDATALLWLAVVAIGGYHGLNPAMGWPLAVANGMTQKRVAAVGLTFLPLGAGHFLAMALVLVPFSMLSGLIVWGREIRIVAGALVILFGVSQLFLRRHPRWLLRIRPGQLLLWSLLMATAHGAALMLLPIVMELCVAPGDTVARAAGPLGHEGAMTLMRSGIGTAVAVALLHSAAMIASGLATAWIVYRHIGLRCLNSAWLDLRSLWALCLVAAGVASLVTAQSA
jgi:hypothetical protein